MNITDLPNSFKVLAAKRAYDQDKYLQNNSVKSSFVFAATPEGAYYWYQVHEAERSSDLPEIKHLYLTEAVHDYMNGRLDSAIGEYEPVNKLEDSNPNMRV